MQSIWNTLPRPFFALAPMEDVTDTVFRQIISSCAPPDIFFTEFTNVDGMFSDGAKEVIHRLIFSKKERPIIAQLWGGTPQNYYEAALVIRKMGFDGIDLNMGCPEKKVVKTGLCAALIKNHALAENIIRATLKGADGLPVSVKTRIGYNTIETEPWIRFLLSFPLAAITVHARTVREMSSVPAHWDEIKRAVDIRNEMKKNTLIVGNGDIASYSDGLSKSKICGADGIMIGRGIFKNPWIFDPHIQLSSLSARKKLNLLEKHILLFAKTWHNTKNFQIMKKFYKMYISDFPGASWLRTKLMEFDNPEDTLSYLRTYKEMTN
ncbi:MAG: tRNA-dihydrouridine synthase [Candidatus Roizmanbacteria bacterium]|nr:tRNA-dihydrouridine synthase [Candidatus Roizmanbacteria bacterium]